ncbi:MAG TPA: DUF434 domain-containing protein [Candidatus Hydrogenedentes bacterium]|nr:DUF434 domain-containing protein [Candidatus Hydrogenedentota bacterium]HIJ73524.1 DUF434 domain-containing protein [Candidatus Hydrogenedentota bacterium]
MGQKQSHRGQHPEDARLFAEKKIAVLREAVNDASFLLTRGYADKAALTIVGDHYQLDLRQRHAVQRAACSDKSRAYRKRHAAKIRDVRGRPVLIDGYNLLITIESVLAGGILIKCRDGCIRDMASVHGSYRRVEETYAAIRLIGETLAKRRIGPVGWRLDAPVSNSGRLKGILSAEAARLGWPWEVELRRNPDKELEAAEETVVTSDGWILDRARRWFNLIKVIVAGLVNPPRIINLG